MSEEEAIGVLSSGEVGRSNNVLLAKKAESSDIRATRVVELTVQEQGMFKYLASSCYRNFQREMARFDIVLDVNQNVPVVIENFWSSSVSKTAFQAFYVEWFTTNLQWFQTFIPWHISTGVGGVSWTCYFVPSSQLHSRGS